MKKHTNNPLLHPARFAGTPPQDEEGMGGETEFGMYQ